MVSTNAAQPARELMNVLEAKDQNGLRLYPDGQVLALVAALSTLLPAEGAPSAAVLAVTTRVGELAGITPQDSAAAMREKLNVYYREHPLDPGMLAAVDRHLRETAAQGLPAEDRTFARLFAESAPDLTPVSSRGGTGKSVFGLWCAGT